MYSPSACVVKRVGKNGKASWHVRCRQSGSSAQFHAGAFGKKEQATAWAARCVSEMIAGNDPRESLRATPPAPRTSLETLFAAFIDSKRKIGPGTLRNYRATARKLCEILGPSSDPARYTVETIVDCIKELEETIQAAAVGQYVSRLRNALDYGDIEPNVARSRKIELPSVTRKEIVPPDLREVGVILDNVRRDLVLPFRLIECLGLRASELCGIRYGDIDFQKGEVRVFKTKTRNGIRKLWCPDELLAGISDLCPLEDRHHDRPVFDDLNAGMLWKHFARACRNGGIAHYHPHDLRHRRISLWVNRGLNEVIAAKWAGHSKPSVTLDVYSHVVVALDDEWGDWWLERYTDTLGRKTSVLEDFA